jgi:hypothetical protein
LPLPQWHFREFAPGDNLSDPDFTKALFASDSDTAVARSLVREALQNSLDARAPGAAKVRVRIAIHRDGGAASPSDAAPFTAGIEPHLRAADNGLPDRPDAAAPVPFLVLEDFGTRGLRGAPDHWKPTGIGENAFFLFFRALGRSGKENESRGRWGVGKFVFPMSSRAHAIWGLTVPDDAREPILMGRAVLRTHETRGAQWHPDGHWGERLTVDSNLVTPSRDPELISRFRAVFGISRRSEPGLSVVVPWLIDEITREGIREAVLGEYFLPLLRGELEVELVENSVAELIDQAAVRTHAEQAEDRKLRERLSLAVMVVDGKGFALDWPVTLPWTELTIRHDDLPNTLRDVLNANLDEGRVVSIRVPVTVGRKDQPVPPEGHLTVHLRRADGLGGLRPLVIRDGISLTEDKTKTVFDHTSLIVAEKCALATAIGDAETPAHEQMQHELLRDRYKYPRKLVSFVRESASTLVRVLRHGGSEDDPFTLASYFPLEADQGPQKPTTKSKPQGKKPSDDLPPLPPPSPRRFRVGRVSGGFRVSGNPGAGAPPEELVVAAAYDVRRGNPFARYQPYDFDLADPGIRKEAQGCTMASAEGNRLVIRPTKPDFAVTVTGFDPERDLIVRANAPGGEK